MSDVLNLRKKKDAPHSPPGGRPSVPGPVQEKEVPAQQHVQQPHTKSHAASSSVSWTASSADNTTNRKILWLVLGLVSLGVLFVIIQKDILFTILLIVFAAVIFIFSKESGRPISAEADESGITVNGKRYYFRSIKSFWIFYEPGGMKELSIELQRWYMPYIRIPLGAQNPLPLRHLFIRYVPEHEHILSVVEAFLSGHR